MARGKKTCKILKEIRRQIAEANDIEYVVSECKYQGDCLGTCPKCESEVKYLEEQLNQRHLLGKAVVLAGISMNVITSNATPVEPIVAYEKEDSVALVDSTNVITGRVTDNYGDPIIGAYIKGSNKKNNTVTDKDGYFVLKTDSFPQTIEISYIGYRKKVMTITPENHRRLLFVMSEEDVTLDGEIPVTFKKAKKSKKKKTDEILFGDAPEQMPSFPGGTSALMKYLEENVQYPDEVCAQGRVVVSFFVEKNGSISNVEILKSVCAEFDKEAVRVIKAMPKWIPGKINGKTIRTKYFVPVTFKVK